MQRAMGALARTPKTVCSLLALQKKRMLRRRVILCVDDVGTLTTVMFFGAGAGMEAGMAGII